MKRQSPDAMREAWLHGSLLREQKEEGTSEKESAEQAGALAEVAFQSPAAEKAGGTEQPTTPGRPAPVRNIHEGHRKRLRERFRQDRSFENFQDHEVLELLLQYAAPRRDTNAMAHALLDELGGNLRGVLEASPDALLDVPGVGETAATIISMVVPLARVWERCAMEKPRRISNCREASQYCKSLLLGGRMERFYVVCLNAQCNVIGQKVISEGSLSEVSAYPRKVMEAALNANAHSVLFCHNHPGGTCAPSREDIDSTLQLQHLLNGVSIIVLDHIIVAGADTYSMIQHGDMDYRSR